MTRRPPVPTPAPSPLGASPEEPAAQLQRLGLTLGHRIQSRGIVLDHAAAKLSPDAPRGAVNQDKPSLDLPAYCRQVQVHSSPSQHILEPNVAQFLHPHYAIQDP